MQEDDLFPIISITGNQFADVEQLGSKEKFWFWHEGQKWLFKEARLIQSPQCTKCAGEDWAEKVAAEIARLLNIPAATVEVPLIQLTELLDRLPRDRVSEAACGFAKEMLRLGYERLLRIR
ncbi:hypothetical protein GO613_08500 [Azoarcus communis]|uniref:hypothetical protein n=1 Tax=Parazoarcus communis TaxID=41977 RepID=UPI001459386E|nr:hypothetical protein [Parazoarcus communis]NMG48138.1 hypothetical protein [Parazoarcus communis]